MKEFTKWRITPDLIHAIETDDMATLEATLHKEFATKRAPNGSEWFKLNRQDIEKIKRWK